MTPQEGLRRQIEIYRGMTGTERLEICFRLRDLTRALVQQGVRHQHPEWSDSQVDREVLRRFTLARDGLRVHAEAQTPGESTW
jgi:hypothetical protein